MVLKVNYHSWPIQDISLLESENNLNLHKLFKKKKDRTGSVNTKALFIWNESQNVKRRVKMETAFCLWNSTVLWDRWMACVTALGSRMQITKKKIYVLTDVTLWLDPPLFTHVSRNSIRVHDRFGRQKNHCRYTLYLNSVLHVL